MGLGLGFGLYDDVWPVYAANIVIEGGGFRVRVRVRVSASFQRSCPPMLNASVSLAPPFALDLLTLIP